MVKLAVLLASAMISTTALAVVGSPFGWLLAGVIFLGIVIPAEYLVKKYFESPLDEDHSRDVALHAYRKYKYHTEKSRFSLLALLFFTSISLVVIVFAQYFVVLDRYFTETASFTTSLSRAPSCVLSEGYSDDLRKAQAKLLESSTTYSDQTITRQMSILSGMESQLRLYMEQCDDSTRSASESVKDDSAPDENLELFSFWPTMTLRASVVAFVGFIIFFFMRNYQYDVSIANRYFAIFAGLKTDEKTAKAIKSNMGAFEANDIKFGPVKSTSIDSVVDLPRQVIEYLSKLAEKEIKNKKDAEKQSE